MVKKAVVMILLVFNVPMAFATTSDNDSAVDNGNTQSQQAFPFDKPCLAFDKESFQTGPELLAVIKENDFPQYCVLYSLLNYQVKQKEEDGYFITGSKLGPQSAENSMVFLKSAKSYQPNQVFMGSNSGGSKPVGQWAYFVGPEEFPQENGTEKELYVFQEIDF